MRNQNKKPEYMNWLEQFNRTRERDLARTSHVAFQESWKLLSDAKVNGRLQHMEFETFLGPDHLHKMFKWIDSFDYGNIPEREKVQDLTLKSKARDQELAKKFKIDAADINFENIGYYNAQDYVFQRPEHQPKSMNPKSILDFGAGHSRQANLLRDDIISGDVHYCAMDVTPACYLVQKLYLQSLGVDVQDYIDDKVSNLNHIPSWRFDLIEIDSIDMVIAVQVLRELSKPMLAFAMANFARVLRPGGALYIRDHIGFHSPNAADLDACLRAFGFVLEWQPHWIDRKHVHGIPRLWRKMDTEVMFGGL